MSLAAIKNVLRQLTQEMKEHLDTHGDGWLAPGDDPYTVSIPGCMFFAKSNPNVEPVIPTREQRLTYGVLRSVAAGLWQWMVIGDRSDMVKFDIEDGRWGIVGMGMFAPR